MDTLSPAAKKKAELRAQVQVVLINTDLGAVGVSLLSDSVFSVR